MLFRSVHLRVSAPWCLGLVAPAETREQVRIPRPGWTRAPTMDRRTVASSPAWPVLLSIALVVLHDFAHSIIPTRRRPGSSVLGAGMGQMRPAPCTAFRERTSFFPNSRFTWTWVCWDGSREGLSPLSSPLVPFSHGPEVVVHVHRRVSVDLDLIYVLSCCSPRSDDFALRQHPSPASQSFPMPHHCPSWRRPSTFLGPSGPGSPQRSVTGQGPDGVCLCPRSIGGVDTHHQVPDL